jgi:ATP adenylyltransferase
MNAYHELEDFLVNKMTMTANYQPVIIRELLSSGGKASVDSLAVVLMSSQPEILKSWKSVLLNWPRKTLAARGIVAYDKKTKEFELLSDHLSSSERYELIDLCDKRISTFTAPAEVEARGVRARLMERANGRCEACGILARDCPLDVDHIVPRAIAKLNANKVRDRNGNIIPVDHFENLQVLCQRCNRSKNQYGKHDFRPSPESLVKAIESILRRVEVLYADSPIQKAETISMLKLVFEEHSSRATESKEF